MSENSITNQLGNQAANRRSFLKKVGMASAALGVAGTAKTFAQSAAPTDIDILNFALNLEYLEAEFYTVATSGQNISQIGISVAGAGTAGATTGGARVTFTNAEVRGLAMELAQDEQAHVTLLQGAIAGLGGSPIAKPAINLNALGLGFGSMEDFLVLARIFEDIGVTAYGGAAPLITNKTILGYAARILAVEAFHSGAIRSQVARLGIASPALDGADHVPPPSGSQYFATDSLSLSEVRTPGQVLYLAFATPSATKGGFFPNGVNGNLNTSAAAPATTDGATLTASVNPIPVGAGMDGVATISWNAPGAQFVEVRVGSPGGSLFAIGTSTGSAVTGSWITDGLTFYLQDITNGKPLTSAYTIGTLTIHLKQM